MKGNVANRFCIKIRPVPTFETTLKESFVYTSNGKVLTLQKKTPAISNRLAFLLKKGQV
jgi:hypothetical protein